MYSDIVMDEVMDLHNDQSPLNLKMTSQKKCKPRPYSRLSTKGSSSASADLNTLRKERARVLLSLIPSDKRKKIGLELRPTQIAQKTNNDKCRPAGQSHTFPYIFWNVVENDTYRSVWWSADGTAVVIHEMMFIAEILQRDAIDRKFGTKSIKNFYRQLNLYGFTRPGFNLENHGNPCMDISVKEVKVFVNSNFQRRSEHLLAQLKRRVGTNATQTSPVADAKSYKASGDGCKLSDEMVSSTSRRPAISSHEMTLLGPSLGLSLMLVALESKRRALIHFLRMHNGNSAAPSTSGNINSICG
ncbi:hypothetical protein AALO_G00245480 [Alosa alosa]|uniref:HSF-type DNA-binding domain-containing protein n=1 Tax=Alosa alosa TaxID=278164 RepID=A0AAV6FSK7_9TELE|nr:heat shock transcription factor, X-linked member 3-like [Alosa alosa]KAG5265710.1 hypothetical protein AALO_G00245480 [Alosa alosa]